MCDKEYIITIGSANIDIAGYSYASLNYADSNPGKIKFTPGGVGRNIAHNLALLGKNSWLMSAVGDDFYGQSLLAQTTQSGVNVDKCLIVNGENTSSYLSLLDKTGEMLVAINDMTISEHISAEFLSQHIDFIQGAKVIVADCNISESTLVWLLNNAGKVPVFVDPVSAWKCVKIREHLAQIHTLKPNRLEAETLSGISLSDRNDAEKVAVNDTGAGDAMMAGLASCWVDNMPFIDSIRFAQGCSSMALASEYTNNPELSVANVKSLVEKQNV